MKNSKDNKLKAFIFFFWSREVSGNELTNNEKELLKIWEENILLELDEEHFNNTKRQILLNIKQKSSMNSKRNSHYTVNTITKFIPVAVLVLLLTIGGIFTYKNYFQPDVYLAESSIRKVTLKDGSVITLLSGAELTVEKSFPADTRLVSLKGDAIFSVAKSRVHPFVVQAENFSTKVLGTVFKISQSGKDKSVELFEGKVAVTYAGTKDSYLNPSQTWTNFGLERTAVIYSQKIDYKSGRQITKIKSLSFNEVPFAKIIDAVKKHYDIDILYPAEIAKKKISAELKGNIDENIDALAFAVGLEVEKGNTNTYTLKK
jgi:transmembrane sensor